MTQHDTEHDRFEDALRDTLNSGVSRETEARLHDVCAQFYRETEVRSPRPAIYWTHRIAWMAAATLMLAVTAWGAHLFYKTHIKAAEMEMTPVKSEDVKDVVWGFNEKGPVKSKINDTSGTFYVFSEKPPEFKSDNPNFNKQLGESQLKEVRQQILDGKGKLFLKKGNSYIYRFKLSDGTQVDYSTNKSLEDERDLMTGKKMQVVTWDSSGPVKTRIMEAEDMPKTHGPALRFYSSIAASTPKTGPGNGSFIITTEEPRKPGRMIVGSKPGPYNPPDIGKDDIVVQLDQPVPKSMNCYWVVMPDAKSMHAVKFDQDKNPKQFQELVELQSQVKLGNGHFIESKDLGKFGRYFVYEFTLPSGKKMFYGSKEKMAEK